MKTLLVATTAILTSLSGAAFAHVSLEGKTAPAGSPFDAAFRVGHGCSGSPTVKLQIRIPAGVVAVQILRKDGWNGSTEAGALEHAVVSGGETFSEAVKIVTWTGSLSAHQPSTFTLHARLADDAVAGGKLVFPVVQQCEKGEERWIDSNDDDHHPAPFLTIVPKR